MTTIEGPPGLRRFFSVRYVVHKIRERGFVWSFFKGLRYVISPLANPLIALLEPVLRPTLSKIPIRFIASPHLLRHIGHIALEPDLYIKTGLLGWRPRYHSILLVKSPAVAPVLLEYWSKHIRVLKQQLLVELLRPLAALPGLRYDTFRQVSLPRGEKEAIVPGVYTVQKSYESELGGRPLLRLPKMDYQHGWRILEEHGVPHDAWFVCLHVREFGYRGRSHQAYRDADIHTYLPAVRAIVDRGGWVIRMGDQTMKPLPQMEHVIDYVHSDMRNDQMDVFFLSQCRFVLGTTAGAFNVAFVFGVPCALANYAPMGHGPYSTKDIWTPKLYWSDKEQRHLTFAESLLSPYRRFTSTEKLAKWGISVVDNTPEDIRDLACEMMNRLDGRLSYSAEDERMQTQFKMLLEADPRWSTSARVGRDFLRNYAWLLPGKNKTPGVEPEDSAIRSEGQNMLAEP